MPQEYIYIPEKTIESRKSIVTAHRPGYRQQTGPEAERFIRRLNGYSDEMLKAVSLSLTDEEAELLAGYLPYNDYQLPLRKLFTVTGYRMDDHLAEVLFRNWQEEFGNPECNAFLKNLTQSDPSFRALLAKNRIDGTLFAEVLDSSNIPLAFDEKILGGQYGHGLDFDKKLSFYGVAEGSYLSVECKRALLTFCGKAEYFSCSENNLIDIVRTYDSFMLKKFLVNFLERLRLGELQAYPGLAAYLRQAIGHRSSRTFKAFFAELPDGTRQRYIDWINLYKINKYFKEDVRSRFWKQFRFINVVRYPVSDVVILEFKSHCAVEFLGGSFGTIYLCEKSVFTDIFYEKLDAMDNEDLRAYFKDHRDQCMEYRNHTGRWQSHMSNYITKRGIAEKIRI